MAYALPWKVVRLFIVIQYVCFEAFVLHVVVSINTVGEWWWKPLSNCRFAYCDDVTPEPNKA